MTMRLRQQVNAVIAVLHVRGENIFKWLFKNTGLPVFRMRLTNQHTLTSLIVPIELF